MAHARSLIALLLLAACGDTPAGEALRGMRPAQPAVAMVEGPALVLTAPRAAVLRPVPGMPSLWRSDTGIAVQLDHGRVVATAGLGTLVMATRFDTPDPLADPRGLVGREVVARRAIDLAGPERDAATMRFGVALTCTLRGGTEAGWILVEERCTGERIAFTNRFRAEASTGRMVESTQWAGDGPGMLSLRRLGA